MRTWTGILAVVLAAFVASAGVAAETGGAGAGGARHDAKIANIRKLLHLMSAKQMKDMMDTMSRSSLKAIEAQFPQDPKADPEAKQALDDYLKALTFSEKDVDELLELMVPLYDKYLDESDVRALAEFYESPAGKNFVRVMPEMMGEMMPRIMGWTMEKLKGPTETLRERLNAISEKRKKEKAAAPRG